MLGAAVLGLPGPYLDSLPGLASVQGPKLKSPRLRGAVVGRLGAVGRSLAVPVGARRAVGPIGSRGGEGGVVRASQGTEPPAHSSASGNNTKGSGEPGTCTQQVQDRRMDSTVLGTLVPYEQVANLQYLFTVPRWSPARLEPHNESAVSHRDEPNCLQRAASPVPTNRPTPDAPVALASHLGLPPPLRLLA